jgi:hypothetical protein
MLQDMKALIAIGAAFAALSLAAEATAFAPSSAKCRSATLVNTELKPTHAVKTATSSLSSFSKTCTYAGGTLPIRITFQVDTASTFATSEKAVHGIVKVKGVGQAAWTTTVGGTLEVYKSGETTKIVAPLITAAKLEALAHKIV